MAAATTNTNAVAIAFAIPIRPTFQIPAVFRDGSVEEIEEALVLGAFVQSHVQTSRSTGDLKTLQQRKDVEIAAHLSALAKAREEAQQHQRALLDAQQEARQKERERVLLEMQEVAAESKRSLDSLQRRCDAAEERRALLEKERSSDIQAAEERTRQFLMKTLELREEQVRQANAAFQSLETAYKQQVEEVRALNDFIRRRTQNVKTKGNEYEAEFRELLLRSFGILDGFAISDTARNGVGHAGDFLVQFSGHTTLWEVKHYDKAVPKAEVDKFRRDVLENQGVRVGVMVSKGTDIVGRTSRGDRELEFVEGKLLVYLSRFDAHPYPEEVLHSLLPLFRIWWETQKEDESAEIMEDTVAELERVLADLTRRRQEWRVHKARLEDTMRFMSEVVEDAESRVDALLSHIRGGSTTTEVEYPADVFRPPHLDEKIRDTIACLMEGFAASSATASSATAVGVVATAVSEVRLSDMTEFFAGRKKMGKDTARKYILAALLDQAVVAAPGKPTLVRGLVQRVQTESS